MKSSARIRELCVDWYETIVCSFFVLAAVTFTATVALQLRTPRMRIAVHSGVEGAPLKALAKRFCDEKGFEVEVVELDYDELFDEELKAVSSPASQFDVIQLDDPWFPALIRGNTRDSSRSPRLAQVKLEDDEWSHFYDSCRRVCQYPYCKESSDCHSPYYAIPFVGNSTLLTRWAASAVSPQDKILPFENPRFAMRIGTANSIVTDFIQALRMIDPNSLGIEHARELSPETKSVFEKIAGLGKQRSLGAASMDDFDLAIDMRSRRADSSIVWSAWTMALRNLPPDPERQPDGKSLVFDVPTHPELGAWLLAVPVSARHRSAGEKFLRFAASKKQVEASVEYGNPPARSDVLEDKEHQWPQHPSFERQAASLSQATPRPRMWNWRSLEATLGETISALYAGELTTEAAWSRINDEIRKLATEP
jgi:spermidine/putrescine-binding protein